MRCPHSGQVVKYTNVAFETDESVLFLEVSSIQRCPDRTVYYSLLLLTPAISMTSSLSVSSVPFSLDTLCKYVIAYKNNNNNNTFIHNIMIYLQHISKYIYIHTQRNTSVSIYTYIHNAIHQ